MAWIYSRELLPISPTPTVMVVQLKGGQHELSTSQGTSSVVESPAHQQQGAVTALRSLEKALPGPILHNHRV